MKSKLNFFGCVKGQAGMVDVMVFSVIVIASITFLFAYTADHQGAKISDVQKQAMNEYAAKTLLMLDYVTVDSDISYATIQKTAVKKTNYSAILNERKKINSIKAEIMEMDSLERSIEQTGVSSVNGKIVDSVENIEEEIEQLHKDVELVHDSADNIKKDAEHFMENIDKICISVKNISDKFGGVFGDINCNIGKSDIIKPLDEIIAETEKTGVELEKIRVRVNEYKKKILIFPSDEIPGIKKSIHEIRCTLIAITSDIDHFMSYFEVGVDLNTSLIDLWPVNANLSGKTISEVTGEAFFTRNNIASTSLNAGEDDFSFVRPISTGAGIFFFRNDDNKEIFNGISGLFNATGEKEEDMGVYSEETTDCKTSKSTEECASESVSSLDLIFDGKTAQVEKNEIEAGCIELNGVSSAYLINSDFFNLKIAVNFKGGQAGGCGGVPDTAPGQLTVIKNGEKLNSYGFKKDYGNYEDNEEHPPYNVTVRIAHTGSDTFITPSICLDEVTGEVDTGEKDGYWRIVERTVKTTCYAASEVKKYYFIGGEYPMLNFVTINYTPSGNKTTIHFSIIITEGNKNITNITEKKVKVNISKEESDENETIKFLKQTILGFMLLGREDLRDDVKEMTKKRLNLLLSDQGYDYCYEAVDECGDCGNPIFSLISVPGISGSQNKIIISSDNINQESCDYVKVLNYSYSFAHQVLPVPENHRGEMRLYIWRK